MTYNFPLPEHNQNATRFDNLYPELEDIEYSYTTSGHSLSYCAHNKMNKPSLDGGMYIKCCNERCTSKYNLYELIQNMIEQKSNEIINHYLYCESPLYSPKGKKRYPYDCDNQIVLNIKLIFKGSQ